MNAGAAILIRQNRYLRRFEQAGATAPELAQTLEALGCEDSRGFDRLVALGVFVHVGEGSYYLDPSEAQAFRSRRRTRMLLALIAAIAGALILFWMR